MTYKQAAAVLLFSLFSGDLAAQSTSVNSPSNLVEVDASHRAAPPETSYLHLGGTSSNGHSLQVNSQYLVLDGKPWLPVMGEFHYTRVPESEWEIEILKMKAAGVDIVSTYVFWIHHEEIEGHFDWTGRRDLRHFVELCRKHGMYVWLRPGPWDHGEVRNGGFPDWLAKLPNTRSNDPTYLQYVTTLFTEIGKQIKGLTFKDGGPIIGTQLENEYDEHGSGKGAEHILRLKQIALAAGIDTPLFSVTGWPSLDFPPQEVIPVSGGYPDGFWYGSQDNLPPSMNYLFNFNRQLGDMGATVPSRDPTGKVDLKHDPYFAAEEAGGMASAYHRRPIVDADDIAALTLTGIGSGINLYGYYMFHGGTNPAGTSTTLEESQATGFPNDLPELTYDFNAPIGEFGQERDSYRKTRLIHLFLNAYGSELAPMTAFAPTHNPRDAADTSIPRAAVRAAGSSGFIFVNNYVRQLRMPARPGFQVRIKLPAGDISVPDKPLNLPADTYFAWPFNLAIGSTILNYSTSQLLTRLETPNGHMVVFFAIPGVAPEFSFNSRNIRSIASPGAKITRTNNTVDVSNLLPGLNMTIEVTDDQSRKTTLLILTKAQAEQTALLRMGGADRLVMSSSSVAFDGARLHLRSIASPTQGVSVLPAFSTQTATLPVRDGLWTTFTFTQAVKDFAVKIHQTRSASPRQKLDMGRYVDWRKKSVPIVPPDTLFDQAATWHLDWKTTDLTGVSQVLARFEYVGDIARLYAGTRLLDDNFFNGLPWEIGLSPDELNLGQIGLDLRILPLPPSAPVYFDPRTRRLLAQSKANPVVNAMKFLPEYETIVSIDPEKATAATH